MTDTQTNQEPAKSDVVPESKPNDQGSVNVTGFVRIFDPKTNETIVETRA
jgi:hypothetical protein